MYEDIISFTKSMPYRIEKLAAWHGIPAALKWCREELGPSSAEVIGGSNWTLNREATWGAHLEGGDMVAVFYFVNERDAVHFKLRWG